MSWSDTLTCRLLLKVLDAKHGYTKVGISFFELGSKKHENMVLVGPAK